MPAAVPRIRPADPTDLPALPALETAADTLLSGVPGAGGGLDMLPAAAPVAELASARQILVAGTPAVGFARLEEVDGQAHLEQLSVHPAAAGSGVGRALLEAALEWAREHGYGSMTLCTFADVPFNAPFYRRCGFEEIAEPDGELGRLRGQERVLGLDALGRRVAMRAELHG